MKLDVRTATKEDFDAHVAKKFKVALADGEISLVLDNTKAGNAAHQRDGKLIVDGVEYPARTPFALTFEGPRSPLLPQGTYEIEHTDTGKLHLFLSPFRQDAECTLYEVVFN